MISILVFFEFLLLSLSLGSLFLRIFKVALDDIFQRVVLSIGLGLGISAFFTLLLGLAGIVYVKIYLLLSLLSIPLSCRKVIADLKIFGGRLKNLLGFSTVEIVLIMVFAVFLILNFLSTLAPISSMDAIEAHFAFPKIYLEHGRIVGIPDHRYSYLPSLMQMLNLVALILSSDIAGALCHFAYGVLTALLLYSFMREGCSRTNSLLGLVIFYTAGMVSWESTSSFLDLSVSFYVMALIVSYFLYLKSRQTGYMYLGAIFAGFAVFSKLSGAAFALIIPSLLVIDLLSQKDSSASKKFLLIPVFWLIVVFVNLPWLARNILEVFNPFYPFLTSIFPERVHPPIDFGLAVRSVYGYGFGSDFKSLLITPVLIFIRGNLFDYGNLYGPITISFLPLALVSLSRSFMRRIFLVVFCYYIFWFFTFQQARFLLCVFPLLVILLIHGMAGVFSKNLTLKKAGILIIAVGLVFNLSVSIVYSMNFIPVVFGSKSRDDFLREKTWSYEDIEWMNTNLSGNDRVAVFARGMYYLDKPYINGQYLFDKILAGGEITKTEALNLLKQYGITHVYLYGDFKGHPYKKIMNKIENNFVLVHSSDDSVRYMRRTLKRKPYKIKARVYKVDYER